MTNKINFTADEKAVIRFCAEEMGLSAKLLEQATRNYLEQMEQKKAKRLAEIKNIYELNENELWELRRHIPVGSLYLSDYENGYGIDRNMLCNLFDGYIEELYYIAENDGMDTSDDVFNEIIDKYDTKENLVNYCHYTVWYEQEDLDAMTAKARAEIEEEFANVRSDIFDCEKIYSIASNLQYCLTAKIAA